MASHVTDNYSGTGMVGGGRSYAVVTATTTSIKAAPGRIFRVLVTAGTGAITIFDNPSAASGNTIWTKATVAVGDIYAIDCPMTTGITVVVAAATTAVFIYS